MGPEPNELLQSARAGDRQAFGELVRQHIPQMARFLRMRRGPLLRSHDETMDLVQSVCAEVLEKTDGRQLPSSPRQFSSWLTTACWHKVLDKVRQLRAQRRDIQREVRLYPFGTDDSTADGRELPAADVPTPSEVFALGEDVEVLSDAMSRLSPDDANLIFVCRILERTHRDAADILQIDESLIADRLHRAMDRLSVLLLKHRSKDR